MSNDPQRAPSKVRELSRSGLGKPAVFVLKFAISASLIGYLLSRVEFRPPPLTGAVITLIMLCLLLLLIQPLVMSLRWWQLMRATGLQVSLADAVRFNWMAIFANQFLPASVGGDAVRIVLSRMRGLPVTTVTLSVAFDRGFALLAMFALILVLSPAASEFIETGVIVALSSTVCLAGVIGLAALRYLGPYLGNFVNTIPRLAFLRHYILRISELASNWPAMTSAFILSLVVHLLSFSAFVAIAHCFSIDIPLTYLVAINALITLAQILPISVAGWGVREGAAVLFFSSAGVDNSTALSISLLAGAAFATASLPGAVMWFLRKPE